MKTLSTILREQNIRKRADILKFVRGAKLLRKDTNTKIDSTEVKFQYSDSNASFSFPGGKRLYASELLVASGGYTIKDFWEQINALNNQILEIEKEKKLINDKINFLEETGSKEYNENEFRAYAIIKTIERENLSNFEKAQLISKLIK